MKLCHTCGRDSVVMTIGGQPRDIDVCIVPVVRALNNAGIATVASCCGHGHRPGNIALADGRELVIAADYEQARQIDGLFPDIHGQPVERPDPWMKLTEPQWRISELERQVEWLERNSVLRNPKQATIAEYLALKRSGDWETPCPGSQDGQHCVHWWDGAQCCSCGDPAARPCEAPDAGRAKLREGET